MRAVARDGAQRGPGGFTLVEIIVALVITSLIAGSIALILSSSARSRDGVRARVEAFTRAQSAAGLIADDLVAARRDSDLFFTRLRIVPSAGGSAAASAGVGSGVPIDERDELLLLTQSTRPTRPADDQNEGPDAEVQYRVVDGSAGSSSESGTGLSVSRLWRRVDTSPDDALDAGGVASPVADGVVSVSLQASDGESWFDEWDSDYDGLPHLVRVTVVAADDQGRYHKVARRVVAFDRTPLVGASVVDEETDESDTGATQPATTQPTTPSTTGGGGRTITTPGTGGGSGGGSGGGAGGGGSGGGGSGGGNPGGGNPGGGSGSGAPR